MVIIQLVELSINCGGKKKYGDGRTERFLCPIIKH
jgi:hypothetical protein